MLLLCWSVLLFVQGLPSTIAGVKAEVEGFRPHSVEEMKEMRNIVFHEMHDDNAHDFTLRFINLILFSFCKDCKSFVSNNKAHQIFMLLSNDLVTAELDLHRCCRGREIVQRECRWPLRVKLRLRFS